MFQKDDTGTKVFTTGVHRPVPALVVGEFFEPDVKPEPTPEPEPTPKSGHPLPPNTLRELLRASEPWNAVTLGMEPTPGVRRIMEKRVNRSLTAVAAWLGGIGEPELAALVEQQIAWPEQQAWEELEREREQEDQ
jgi:hypothetical protein